MIKYELLCQGDSRMLKIIAEKGDKIKLETGAMVGMTNSFQMATKIGSVGKLLGRALNEETALIQEYTATSTGEVLISPTFSGDILAVPMNGNISYRIGSSSFLACSEGVDISTKVNKLKTVFGSGEGLLSMQASGHGYLFVNSCGSIHKIHLEEGQEYIVDNSHLVLWDSSMNFTSELSGSIIQSIFGGEGFVSKFTGPGDIYIQTRKPILYTPTK